ncbi:MAG TPA: hypothetical protein VM282_11170 [Acidimicrobiales bacterium]|nr:hypothetical protein [Acidimicrobiales bacterium]
MSSLLTPQVMQEVVKPYEHQVVFPERVHIDDPSSPESQFFGEASPVLVLTIENQGVCAWGVPLDGDDDPPVLVGGDLDGDTSPIVSRPIFGRSSVPFVGMRSAWTNRSSFRLRPSH